MHLFLKGTGGPPLTCAGFDVFEFTSSLLPTEIGTITVDVSLTGDCGEATFGSPPVLTLLIAGGAEWVDERIDKASKPAVNGSRHSATAPHTQGGPAGRALTAAYKSFNLVPLEDTPGFYTTENLAFFQATSYKPFTVQVVELTGNGNALDG